MKVHRKYNGAMQKPRKQHVILSYKLGYLGLTFASIKGRTFVSYGVIFLM